MTKIEPRTLKGFRDFGPEKQMLRQEWFSKIQNVFATFGFLPMATPALEYKDVLMGKYGDDEKLVYSFKDNGERDVAMRYDLTVPLARYVAQNQGQLTYPFKRYQIAPVWRADNPQKGRFREFYQCDIDIVGSNSVLADAEVIACLCKALEAVGLTDYKVRLNDRRNFGMFGENPEAVIRALDKLDKIGREAVLAEIENGDPGLVEVSMDYIDGKTALNYQEQLETLKNQIVTLGIPQSSLTIDRTIARGLDYYTSTVFEIIIPSMPEFGSVCSGGRYDSLVDQFSKTSVSAVGGSIGIDRLFDALLESGKVPTQSTTKVLVLNLDENLQEAYARIASQLRQAGINVDLYYELAKLDKQFKYAENKNIPWALLIGEDENSRGVVKLKNLETRDQQELRLEEAIETLK